MPIDDIDTRFTQLAGRYVNRRSFSQPVFIGADQIACLDDQAGTNQISVVTLSTGEIAPVTSYPDRILSLKGSATSGRILFGMDRDGNERQQIWAIDAVGAEPRRLTHADNAMHEPGALSSWGATALYRTNARDASTFDIASILLDGGEPETWLENGGQVTPVALHSEGQRALVVRNNGNLDADLLMVHRDGGVVNLTPQRSEKWIFDTAFDAEGTGVWFLSNLEREFVALMHLDLATGERRVVHEAEWDVELFQLSPDGQKIALSVNENGSSRPVIIAVDGQSLVSAKSNDILHQTDFDEGTNQNLRDWQGSIAILDRAESSEKFNQNLGELQERIASIRPKLASMIAQGAELEIDLAQTRKLATEWQTRAERATAVGKENLAQEALRRKKDNEENANVYEQQMAVHDQAIEKLKRQLQALEAEYEEATSRRDAMLTSEGRAEAKKREPRINVPLGVIDRFSWSPDSSQVVFGFSTVEHPSALVIADLQGHTRVIAAESAGDTPETVAPEAITYETWDGRQIPAFFFRPKGPGPFPAILEIHGGPESQRQLNYNVRSGPAIQFLTSLGIAVLALNVRGSTGYGKTYSHLDDQSLRLDSVQDLVSAADWLRERDDIIPDRIALFGASYGGFMTLAALAFHPEYWAAGVELVGIANFVTFLERTGPWRRAHREAEYGSLADDREMLARISPIHKVDQITAPLLIFHGREDPRVPLYESEQIADALRSREIDVSLTVFDDEGHSISKRKNVLGAFARMGEFLTKHLGL